MLLCRLEGVSFVPWLRFAEDIAFTQMALAAGKHLLKLRSIYFFQGRLQRGGCQAEREGAAAAAGDGARLLLEPGAPVDAHATPAEKRILHQLRVRQPLILAVFLLRSSPL